MNCESVRERMGLLLDGQLTAEQQAALRAHLETCPDCAREYTSLQALAARIEKSDPGADAKAPGPLWDAIRAELATVQIPRSRHGRLYRFFRRPLSAAASILVLIGLGVLAGTWLTGSARPAEAAVVDYSILLNNLSGDVNAAFDRFINYYKAQPIDVNTAHKAAPALSFSLPPELAGGYRLKQVYRLKFGKAPGVAARYSRDGEPLMVFFHPPVDKTRLGTHRDQPCHVGHTHGYKVEVGAWRLLHFTDPTTCHCVLSNLDPQTQLVPILQAVAPQFSEDQADRVHE